MSSERLQLSDGAVTIRQVGLDQLDQVYEAIRESLPELHATLTWATLDYGRTHAEEFLRHAVQAWVQETEFTFYTFDAQTDRLLGGCGLNYLDAPFRRCNLGYWCRTSETGRGATTAATKLLARWALEEKGFERVEIVVELHNEASQRVARKAGAQWEGVARRRVRLQDQQLDGAVYSLTRLELASLR